MATAGAAWLQSSKCCDATLILAVQEPSPEFLQQLREYTGFRMKLGAAKAFKSF